MLTLLLALAVSQSPVSDESAPPPPPPPAVVTPEAAPPIVTAPPSTTRSFTNSCASSSDCSSGLVCTMGTCTPPRSARLLEEPRASAVAMVGRVGMSLAIGFVGELVGELAGLGLGVLGLLSRSVAVFVGTFILGTLVRYGFVALGVAIGSALFGRDFARDLRDVMPVAAITVGSAVLIGVLLAFLFPYYGTLIALLPLIGAAIVTPIIVQLRKPEEGATAMRDSSNAGGLAVAF